MDEIEDLIRLLVEAPAEGPALERPKELLDRIAMEKAVAGEAEPKGPAVPPASPVSPVQTRGMMADPKTGVPVISAQVVPTSPYVESIAPVVPALAPKEARPAVTVMTPEMFSARSVTPSLTEAVSAVPAEIRKREATSVAAVSPTARVEMVVPAAFPFDIQQAFRVVDEMRPPAPPADILAPQDFPSMDTSDVESTAEYTARSFYRSTGVDQTEERSPL